MGERGLPTEAKTWKGVAPQGWNSDLNREGVAAVHWMPEKFSAFPRTRACLHLANRNPAPPHLPAKGDVELRLAGRKLANGLTHKTSHASYFPAHHPVGVMLPIKWNAVMFRGKSRSPRSLQTPLWQRAEPRQPCEDGLLAMPETANCYWWSFQVSLEKNASATSIAAYQKPGVALTCSGKGTTDKQLYLESPPGSVYESSQSLQCPFSLRTGRVGEQNGNTTGTTTPASFNAWMMV